MVLASGRTAKGPFPTPRNLLQLRRPELSPPIQRPTQFNRTHIGNRHSTPDGIQIRHRLYILDQFCRQKFSIRQQPKRRRERRVRPGKRPGRRQLIDVLGGGRGGSRRRELD